MRFQTPVIRSILKMILYYCHAPYFTNKTIAKQRQCNLEQYQIYKKCLSKYLQQFALEIKRL